MEIQTALGSDIMMAFEWVSTSSYFEYMNTICRA